VARTSPGTRPRSSQRFDPAKMPPPLVADPDDTPRPNGALDKRRGVPFEDHDVAARSGDRMAFWTGFINEQAVHSLVEIGLFWDAYAAGILDDCPALADQYRVS